MRVVLAEDLALLRDGLIRLLEAHDFEVVEAVDNGPSLLRALLTHKPDVAVVDVRLPPTFTDEGLAGGHRGAGSRCPGCRCWSSRSTSSSSTRANCWPTAAAASATCSRTGSPTSTQFVDAVRQVAGGGTAMDPEVVAQLLTRRSAETTRSPR